MRRLENAKDEFGPQRAKTGVHADVYPANSFIGNMLRMELLSQVGRSRQILDESISYLLYMADRTGTLWENVGTEASCDHGFASHIVHTLYRDVLGLYQVDRLNKRVRVRLGDAPLDWCEGSLLTPEGPVALRWDRRQGKITYRLSRRPDTRSRWRTPAASMPRLWVVCAKDITAASNLLSDPRGLAPNGT